MFMTKEKALLKFIRANKTCVNKYCRRCFFRKYISEYNKEYCCFWTYVIEKYGEKRYNINYEEIVKYAKQELLELKKLKRIRQILK